MVGMGQSAGYPRFHTCRLTLRCMKQVACIIVAAIASIILARLTRVEYIRQRNETVPSPQDRSWSMPDTSYLGGVPNETHSHHISTSSLCTSSARLRPFDDQGSEPQSG